MSKKYIIEYSDKFLIGGKYNEESISNFKIKRNMESYKVDNINSKKLSSVYKLFFNFEGDNDIEFLSSEKFHSIHSPYWWLRCFFWKTQEKNLLVKAYKKLLERHILKKPFIINSIDKLMNPIMGKSFSMYFEKI